MNLFGELAGVVENAIAQHPRWVSGVIGDALTSVGGLDGLVAQLNAAGLGAQVNSWLGNEANQPITADEMKSALTPQHFEQIAAKLGIPADAVASVLAQHLPNAVRQASFGDTLKT